MPTSSYITYYLPKIITLLAWTLIGVACLIGFLRTRRVLCLVQLAGAIILLLESLAGDILFDPFYGLMSFRSGFSSASAPRVAASLALTALFALGFLLFAGALLFERLTAPPAAKPAAFPVLQQDSFRNT